MHAVGPPPQYLVLLMSLHYPGYLIMGATTSSMEMTSPLIAVEKTAIGLSRPQADFW